jgi:hypothetical protein
MNQIDQILGESMISYSTNRPLILPVQSIFPIEHTVLSVNKSNNISLNVINIFDSMIDQREYITDASRDASHLIDSPGLLITKS